MNLLEIEKNKKFWRYVLSKGVWKNYAFVPPSLVLFGGLFGLLYLYQSDRLLSWYSSPFVIIFTIGTIWFKSTRKYLVDRKIKNISRLVICAPVVLSKVGRVTFLLFSSNNDRHRLNFNEQKKSKILENKNFLNDIELRLKKGTVALLPDNSNIFIIKYLSNIFTKRSIDDVCVVFIDEQEVQFVSKRVISKF